MKNTKQSLSLHHKLTFWYQHFIKGEDRFEDCLLPVANIESVQKFWAYYQHFKRPVDLPIGSYIYLFKEGVKPVWQDPANKNGGAFVLRFQKLKSNRLWQDILLGVVSAKADIFNNLNGVRLKVRKDFVEIDFWMSKVDEESLIQFYRKWIIQVTSLQNDTPLEVIHFQIQV